MSEHSGRGPDADRISRRLDAERPAPTADFESNLRRSLAESRRQTRRRDRFLVAAYAGCGLLLLAIAAIGLAGAGPFAA